MNDPMTILKADHREVKAMLKTLAESEPGPAREELCKKAAAALSLHMQIEEELVYPLITDEVGEEEGEEATIEHGLAREGLDKMAELLSKPGFGAAVEMLAGGINHHVHEEETELLPELKAEMGREQWLALGDRIAEVKKSAGEDVPAARPARKPRKAKR